MKLPEFNAKGMRWDQYRKFHTVKWGVFVQTMDGELLVMGSGDGAPDQRAEYADYNIAIRSTTDRDCPALYLPGSDKPIVAAALHRKGGQLLLIDYDLKKAFRLSWSRKPHSQMPEFARGAYAYYPKAGSAPYVHSKIKQYAVHSRRREYAKWLDALVKVATVTWVIQGNTPRAYVYDDAQENLWAKWESGLTPGEVLVEGMTRRPDYPGWAAQMAARAYSPAKLFERTKHDYLEIRP